MENKILSLEKLQQYIAEKPATLIYFYNEQCAPCKSLRPKVIEMKEAYFPKLELVLINSAQHEIPSYFGIYDNPSLLVFFDRKEYIRVSKYVSIAQLKEQIDRYYQMMFEA